MLEVFKRIYGTLAGNKHVPQTRFGNSERPARSIFFVDVDCYVDVTLQVLGAGGLCSPQGLID